ncbi:unnamed protein product, partial [marine sediment metagenome]
IADILGRIGEIVGSSKNIDIAKNLKVSPSVCSNWKDRGAIPWAELFKFSLDRNVSFDWLLTGGQFENKNINSKEPGELMKLKEEQISILKKYAVALEENKRLQAKIASYEKILTFCQPPVEDYQKCSVPPWQ